MFGEVVIPASRPDARLPGDLACGVGVQQRRVRGFPLADIAILASATTVVLAAGAWRFARRDIGR
ncbi:hypothetical protein [Actinocorallia herbida]|uniref:hypothetical protein n=1 Tax=Actinocorallia herbida TaxID=58109 RepID=UPI000F4BD982|nr:hypothetical protein [Actinocorallia herbida]